MIFTWEEMDVEQIAAFHGATFSVISEIRLQVILSKNIPYYLHNEKKRQISAKIRIISSSS